MHQISSKLIFLYLKKLLNHYTAGLNFTIAKKSLLKFAKIVPIKSNGFKNVLKLSHRTSLDS